MSICTCLQDVTKNIITQIPNVKQVECDSVDLLTGKTLIQFSFRIKGIRRRKTMNAQAFYCPICGVRYDKEVV